MLGSNYLRPQYREYNTIIVVYNIRKQHEFFCIFVPRFLKILVLNGIFLYMILMEAMGKNSIV